MRHNEMQNHAGQGLESLHFILTNKAKENTWRKESVCVNGSLRGKIKPCTIKLRHSYVEHKNILFFVKKSQKNPVCFINYKEVTAKGVKVWEVVFESEGNDESRPAVTYQREWAWISHISSMRKSSRIWGEVCANRNGHYCPGIRIRGSLPGLGIKRL